MGLPLGSEREAGKKLTAFAGDWYRHREDVVADFRQFYGIDLPIDDDAEMADLRRMALLWAALPRESRTARRCDPSLAWGDAEYLMHSMEYSLRVIAWQRTKDAEKRRNFPEPWKTPGEAADAVRRRDRALASRQEIDEILGMR